jgi:tetratricopeptide (TPR) repeat protein
LALRPDLDEAYYLRGLVFRMMKQYNQAVASYSEALQLNPKRTAAYLERGMSYLSLNKVTPAISDFNQVIEMQPASGQAYYYLAEAYYQRKEFSRLRPLVEKALQLGYPIKPMELEKLKKCLPQK